MSREMSKSKCMSFKKDELIKMCKKHNLKTDGTKDDLCKRLLSLKPKKKPSPKPMSKSKCMSYKKDELIKMCKKHNLKTDGTKDDLCKRLLSKEEKSPPKNGKRLHVRHLKDDEDIDTV